MPALVNTWVNGAALFLITGAVPSPKFQVHVVKVPTAEADESVNVINFVSQEGILKPKFAHTLNVNS